MDAIWKPYGVSFETSDVTPQETIGGITNFSVGDNINIDRPNVDGSPYPAITTLLGRDESIQVTSLNVDDVLDTIGISGGCIRGDDADGGIKLWLAKWDQCSLTPVSGSVHRYFGIEFGTTSPTEETRGIYSFETLSCQHRGDATATFRIDPAVSDGQTVAMNEGANQALPTISDNRNRYTLGKMTVGGVELTGKLSFELSSNVSVNRIAADSNPGAEFVHIQDNKPLITIRGLDPSWNIPKAGVICQHADTIFYLRRRGQTAGLDFEPDTDPDHIKITAKGRAFRTQPGGGASNSPSETTLTIYPEYDFDNTLVPLLVLTGQAIT